MVTVRLVVSNGGPASTPENVKDLGLYSLQELPRVGDTIAVGSTATQVDSVVFQVGVDGSVGEIMARLFDTYHTMLPLPVFS